MLRLPALVTVLFSISLSGSHTHAFPIFWPSTRALEKRIDAFQLVSQTARLEPNPDPKTVKIETEVATSIREALRRHLSAPHPLSDLQLMALAKLVSPYPIPILVTTNPKSWTDIYHRSIVVVGSTEELAKPRVLLSRLLFSAGQDLFHRVRSVDPSFMKWIPPRREGSSSTIWLLNYLPGLVTEMTGEHFSLDPLKLRFPILWERVKRNFPRFSELWTGEQVELLILAANLSQRRLLGSLQPVGRENLVRLARKNAQGGNAEKRIASLEERLNVSGSYVGSPIMRINRAVTAACKGLLGITRRP